MHKSKNFDCYNIPTTLQIIRVETQNFMIKIHNEFLSSSEILSLAEKSGKKGNTRGAGLLCIANDSVLRLLKLIFSG